MANNKVQLANGTVLIDLTDTTATASDVVSGSFFYDAAGVKREGTLAVDETYSITKTLTNVTSSADDTKVIAGNSFYTELTPTSGYAISSITVTMGGVDITDQVFKPGVGAKAITANGTYTAANDSLSGYSSVVVNVPGGGGGSTLGTKTITENGTYNASSDSLDGYSSVTVNVPTGTARTSADLTASGATVTVPAGLYTEAASKSVASGSASTPATTITANPSISVSSSGLITASVSGSKSVTPSVSAGYVSSGTAGTVSVSGSNTEQLTTMAAQTVTPSASSQTVQTSGKYMTGNVTVNPIPSQYIVPSGTKSITENGAGIDVSAYASVDVAVPTGGGVNIDTKTVTASNYPVSISFSSMQGEPKAFFLRSTSQISSSGSTTYYYIIDLRYNGTNTTGNCFRIGSTRRVENITSGCSWSYSGTTLTITSSASSRSASPGAFNNGYELVYIY